jgi:hypothetical protein
VKGSINDTKIEKKRNDVKENILLASVRSSEKMALCGFRRDAGR